MIMEYIEAARARATYEIIDDEEPYYGEVPDLSGVWATGKTLEECRKNLAEVIDGWIIIRLRRGLPVPKLGDITIEEIVGMNSSAKVLNWSSFMG
jgi:predicted RNase H-like HicB family nuclease